MSVEVTITSPSIGLNNISNYSSNTIVISLSERVYSMTGFELNSISFKINGKTNQDESEPLSTYSINGKIQIEVSGKSEFGDLGDVNSVKKFEISDTDYDLRTGTIRELKRKAGIKVKGEVPEKVEEPPTGINLEDRCEVELPDKSHHRGTVKFIGTTHSAKGYWIGIELDEPYGKNDGSIQGQRYFTCQEKYGLFLKPSRVNVGDFPPIDWEDELKDEM